MPPKSTWKSVYEFFTPIKQYFCTKGFLCGLVRIVKTSESCHSFPPIHIVFPWFSVHALICALPFPPLNTGKHPSPWSLYRTNAPPWLNTPLLPHFLNPLHPKIIMHILHAVLYAFPRFYQGEFVKLSQSLVSCWSFHLYSCDFNLLFRDDIVRRN